MYDLSVSKENRSIVINYCNYEISALINILLLGTCNEDIHEF